MTACLDVGGLADCLIGYYEGNAGEEILETYATVRRDIFLKYVDARSIKNLDRVRKADPWTVLETDPFFGIIQDLNKDKDKLKEFLMVSVLPGFSCLCLADHKCRKPQALNTTLRSTTTTNH